ncbi:type VI secretion system baseplate subunit TssF [Parasulfitobacter algicola]|uniref:Type VI secretion system baseplate subunit TssF n=1 Tax=Parasulfitobacter algicola TaxID=2614809 RepID=A0ABX2ILI0_9RHOB|nr:type VI secretion system baseplate subunit TssF [Sulfitobacter algicola]
MVNRFLEFYSDELNALRSRATRFSEAFPKIAGRLRLSKDTSDDPHVERLIQSFAYTSARIRQKIDDSLPELTDALLETLYPHYLSPVPAMTIVQLHPQKTLDTTQVVPRHTQIVSDPIESDVCRFRTTQSVTLAPVSVADVRLMARPIDAPQTREGKSSGCLAITLKRESKTPLFACGLQTLRFYIAAPSRQAIALHALLFNHCTEVGLAAHANDADAVFLPPTALQQVGFDDAEGLLPYPENSFLGYRTLTEFFALPQKFLFFDVDVSRISQSDEVVVYLYLDAAPGRLERDIDNTSLLLHCTPMVNHFKKRAEPITLDGTRTTYSLMADARRSRTQRVHSVTSVTLTDDDGNATDIHPFFHRLSGTNIGKVGWQLRRHTRQRDGGEGETSLAFVDEINRPRPVSKAVASIDVLATNADLPSRLPFGGGQPKLYLADAIDAVTGISCLQPLSSQYTPDDVDDRAWRLLSHLSLNHLSISKGGAPALRNIISLYDITGAKEPTRLISSIHEIETKPGIARLGNAMVPGSDITLIFDDHVIDPSDAYFFGTMIDRFLGCYATINTFTRLSLKMKNRTDLLAEFPPRAGEEAMV